ncbi:GNAT family N-acetyltransferase [Streptomyces sp. NBC_00829]|uniref:GNAT family N-acetyltransferase n=1 Tax=Streptomyces sp. NBC_00829 TaxID=2903679 RepID=UPI00386AA4B2|nr:GNAT family N-acetyltransferase [Streptomyces sp. NBC_00829]
MSLEIRTITDSELTGWLRAMFVGFLDTPEVTDEEVEIRRGGIALDRTQGAFEDGRCVATFRSFDQQLTVVGGSSVPVNAITNVTVSPTHRRRGLLSRMMEEDLARAKERGDVAATLIAMEYQIYGRYGFGPATWVSNWQIDVLRAGLDPRWSGPDDGGSIDLVDGDAVRVAGPELHDRLRVTRHGVVSRDKRWWQFNTGELSLPSQPWKFPHQAFYRTDQGRVDGLVVYSTGDTWHDQLPDGEARVRSLIAASPAAERALWHYLLSVDWITKVSSGFRAPDDLLPLFLPNPRAARITTQVDFMWVRLLDVPRALEARAYRVPGSLVLDVHDGLGLSGGRFRLDAQADGASCSATTLPAELSLGLSGLSALYLGDESASRLMALGLAEEHRPGAAATADALLRTASRPWCPDYF